MFSFTWFSHRHNVSAAALSFGVFGVLAGCSAFMHDAPGITYSKSVQELGIIPVYPPREDLQVGDLYGADASSRNSDKARLHTVFIQNVNLTSQIKGYLNGRYKFGATTTQSEGILKGTSMALPSQVDARASGNVLDRSDEQTLPITGLPAIEVDSGLSIGAAGGSQQLAAVFGFAAAKTEKMTLHFGMVTSYSVSIPTALDVLDGLCRYDPSMPRGWKPAPADIPQACNNVYVAQYINQKYQLADQDPERVQDANVLLVSKVYLARAISYTFNDATMAAAAAAAAGQGGGNAPTVPTLDPKVVQDAVAKDDPALLEALASIQKAMADTVVSNQNQKANGVSLSVATYDRNSVTFQEIYERPVVVGYEAVKVPARIIKNGQVIR